MGLREEGPADDRIEAFLDDGGSFDLLLEFDHRPPALTADDARRVMQRLTEAAGIEVAEGYLQPHGGRQGIDEVIIRTRRFAAAARVLDDSEELVRERYSHIEAGESAEELGKVIETVDKAGGD